MSAKRMDERSALYMEKRREKSNDERSAPYMSDLMKREWDKRGGSRGYILAEGWAKKHTDAKKELLERVNERMQEGYTPVGGVSVTTIIKHAVIGEFQVILYSQGMVKDEQR